MQCFIVKAEHLMTASYIIHQVSAVAGKFFIVYGGASNIGPIREVTVSSYTFSTRTCDIITL
jgi:hypothetical protein